MIEQYLSSLNEPYAISRSWIWRAVLIKLFGICTVPILMQYVDIVDLFSYDDFDGYKTGGHVYANFLYSYFVKLIGATSIGDPRLYILGIIIAVFLDILVLHLFSKYFLISFKTLIFYGLFSLHPYFSTYAWRFDTLDFASFSCILFLIILNYRLNYSKAVVILLLILLLSMFRMSALVFWLAGAVAIYLSKDRLQVFKIKNLSLVVMLILSFLIVRQNGSTYLYSVANATEIYGWSLDATRSIFGNFGYIFDLVIHYTFKITVLLGGREALYTEGIKEILSYKAGIYQLCSVPFFAVFHFVALLSFVRFTQRSGFILPVLISFSALIVAVFTVGHMRYLLPYQPMILFGSLYLLESRFFGKNCSNSGVSTK